MTLIHKKVTIDMYAMAQNCTVTRRATHNLKLKLRRRNSVPVFNLLLHILLLIGRTTTTTATAAAAVPIVPAAVTASVSTAPAGEERPCHVGQRCAAAADALAIDGAATSLKAQAPLVHVDHLLVHAATSVLVVGRNATVSPVALAAGGARAGRP